MKKPVYLSRRSQASHLHLSGLGTAPMGGASRGLPGIGQGWYDITRAGPSLLKCVLAPALVLVESARPRVKFEMLRGWGGGGERGRGER